MKENSDDEAEISNNSDNEKDSNGEQDIILNKGSINFNENNTSENIFDEAVITKIKESKQLSVDEMSTMIGKCLDTKKKDQKANIIDKNFLLLVWSFNLGYYKEKNEKGIDYNGLDKNLLSTLFFYCADEFFHCLYLLDIGFEDLDPVVQKQIKNDDYEKKLSEKFTSQFNITHKPWRNSIAYKMFYDQKKPLDVKFFVWLNENSYFAKPNEIVFYESYGGHPKAVSFELKSFDEFESICKKRKEDKIGNYEFETFDEFKKFVGLDESDDQYKNEYYSKVRVSVKSLLDVLKNENKFLTSNEFIKLVNRENIFFDKPENLTENDIEGWNNYKEFVNKSGKIKEDEKEKRREARKKYWAYIKYILFGNTAQNTRGLLDIKQLSNADLKNIANCLSDKFELFTGISLFCDSKDIFNNQSDRYKSYIVDDLQKFKSSLFPTNIPLDDRKIKIESDITAKGMDNKCTSTKNSTNSRKRLIAGIIFLFIGIIGCVSVVLSLGLASKLAIALFLLFITIAVVGIVCLFWKKISGCLNPCCLKIGMPYPQRPNEKENYPFIDKQNPTTDLKTESEVEVIE